MPPVGPSQTSPKFEGVGHISLTSAGTRGVFVEPCLDSEYGHRATAQSLERNGSTVHMLFDQVTREKSVGILADVEEDLEENHHLTMLRS